MSRDSSRRWFRRHWRGTRGDPRQLCTEPDVMEPLAEDWWWEALFRAIEGRR